MKRRVAAQSATGGVERESTVDGPPSESHSEQYTLAKILGVWALAAVPMGIQGWIVFPLLAPDFESNPLGSGVTRLVLFTLGLIWLFALSMIIVRREEGNLHWATVKRRLRLNAPREPATGQPRARLWLWVVPFLVAVAVVQVVLASRIENVWVSYQVRLNSLAHHAAIRPPVVAEMGAEELRLVAQSHASLHQRLLQLLDLLEVAVCNTLIGKRPQPL